MFHPSFCHLLRTNFACGAPLDLPCAATDRHQGYGLADLCVGLLLYLVICPQHGPNSLVIRLCGVFTWKLVSRQLRLPCGLPTFVLFYAVHFLTWFLDYGRHGFAQMVRLIVGLSIPRRFVLHLSWTCPKVSHQLSCLSRRSNRSRVPCPARLCVLMSSFALIRCRVVVWSGCRYSLLGLMVFDFLVQWI